jgi:hypothetical protein
MADVTPDAAYVERAKSLSEYDSRPALTGAEVTAAVRAYPLPDVDGLTIVDAGWTQGWDLNAAVAELWGKKAGKVAGDFNFQADSAAFSKGDVIAHCLDMQATYAAKVHGSTSTAAGFIDPLRGVVVNG